MSDAVSLCAPPVCDLCADAAALANTSGDVVVCDCERAYAPRERPSGVVDVATQRPVRPAAQTEPRRGPRLVYVATDEAPVALSPLERAGVSARSLTSDDPELVRIRRVLAELRPDCHDPLVPPLDGSKELPPPPPLRLEGEDDWRDLPRGLVLGGVNGSEYTLAEQRASVAKVLASLDDLAPEHAETLRWMREHATLGEGLRGLYAEAGVWAAKAGRAPAGTLAIWQHDLGARREGAPALGRRVVLAAASAWGR